MVAAVARRRHLDSDPDQHLAVSDRRAGRDAGRRAAGHRHHRHRRHAAADHFWPAAGRRADHARRHLLRRAIWRFDHVDPGQNFPRGKFPPHPPRWVSHGERGPGGARACPRRGRVVFFRPRGGRAGPALAIAAIGSFFAGCVATVLIAVLGAPLTKLALAFGPAEYFSLMVLGLIFAVVLAKGSILKAIAMIVFGLLLSMVGSDIET